MIKAIRTSYQGQTYRSKLEARWAYFLTQLGISFEYEPQLIDLGGGLKYLPDFRLHNFWLEIKGDMCGDENGLTIINKCERLASLTSLPVVLAFYDPLAAKCAVFLPDGRMLQAHFGMCRVCGALAVKYGRSYTLCAHPNAPLSLETEQFHRRLIFNAAVAARDL